ncbi:MAG: 1-phosphofructokinase family hexose kinase [Butyricicoccaceae bacterium]
MIYTVTLNPALDKTVEIPGMALDTVNRITEMRTDPGGKGINVSKVIAKLGGDSRAVGILGGESGRTLEKLLENENFTTQFRFVEGQTRTNIKIIDRVGHTNTDINEPGLTVTDADLDALLNDLLAEVRRRYRGAGGQSAEGCTAGHLPRVDERMQKRRCAGVPRCGRRFTGRRLKGRAVPHQAE